jgi:molybdate transport system ATP-binding protein
MLEIAIRHQRGNFLLDVDCSAPTPGVVALFGRSGCGKTTLVNLLAGLLPAQQGRICVDGQVWLDTSAGINLPTEQRRVGYVFQESRLFPHYSVRGNLLYGAHRQPGGAVAAAQLDEIVDLLALAPLLTRRPGGLSGGEKQRVALGRALLSQPRLLLLDEPLSSLDAARRDEVLPYLERLRDQLRIPMIFVSHQFDEVLRLATEVIVLEGGQRVAQGDLSSISRSPALRAIVGPQALGAVVDGWVQESETPGSGLTEIRVGNGTLRLQHRGAQAGQRVRVQLLARDLILASQEPRGLSVRNQLRGTVQSISADADSDLVEIDIGGATVVARITQEATLELQLQTGLAVWVLVKSVSIQGYAYSRPTAPAN